MYETETERKARHKRTKETLPFELGGLPDGHPDKPCADHFNPALRYGCGHYHPNGTKCTRCPCDPRPLKVRTRDAYRRGVAPP